MFLVEGRTPVRIRALVAKSACENPQIVDNLWTRRGHAVGDRRKRTRRLRLGLGAEKSSCRSKRKLPIGCSRKSSGPRQERTSVLAYPVMWYWVVLTTASVVIGTLVVFSIVGLFEVLREPTLEGTVDNDLGSSAATSPDPGA